MGGRGGVSTLSGLQGIIFICGACRRASCQEGKIDQRETSTYFSSPARPCPHSWTSRSAP